MIALGCVAVLAVGAVATGGSPGRGEGQAQAGRPAAANPEGLKPFVYGARGCANCHDRRNRRTDTPEELERWICQMDEFPAFDEKDKHKLAFRALTGPRGREMGRLLGTDVTKLEACVNCHSVPTRGVESLLYTPELDGVTCVACHGTYKEWVLNHQIPDQEWLGMGRKDKELRFGMTDLWDPVRRAETCASCHIGKHAQGKVVTHAMYAAGHPPLSGFEVATFSDAQPRHWQYLSEKTPRRLERLRPTPDPNNLDRAQLIVIGGLVELRESMKLVADQAEAGRRDPVGAPWPDFARFDCYACHHELRTGAGASWRQARRRDPTPGRPAAPGWPLALIPLAIEAGDPRQARSREAELNDGLAGVRDSFKARLFGDPGTLVPAARKVAAWVDSAIKDLDRTVFDDARSRVLLERLCKIAIDAPPDYDSARQIAWAFRVIYRESVPEGHRDSAIEGELAGLETELALDLPPARTQAPIETALSERLKKAAEFDPAQFQAHFARIAERLAAPPPPTFRTAGR